MSYLILFSAGLAVGGLVVWLSVMGRFDRATATRQEADQLTAAARRDLRRAADQQAAVEQRQAALVEREQGFGRQAVSYADLQAENGLLKRDVRNLDLTTRKLALDGEAREQSIAADRLRSDALAQRYLAETIRAVISAVGPSNFTACKQRLADAVARCRAIGFPIAEADEARLMSDLRVEFERAVRVAFEREEQARIRAQIRVEERRAREVERELKALERERAIARAAYEAALAAARGERTAEVARLQQRLADAEEKSRRAMSMAQQTKAGHVYVISNVGSLGVDVYKVGMTRRLKPEERVDELGSASVPFPFDVHLMISTLDAPKLENALHRALHKRRVNRANPRKEFFRVTLDEIVKVVAAELGTVEFRADPEAVEYRQSLSMSDEDAAFVERTFADLEGDDDAS